MALPREDVTNDLTKFFETIWRDTEGYVYLPTKYNDVWKKNYFKWPQNKQSVSEWVLSESAAGKDVYYAPSIFKDASKSAEKSDVLGSWVVWCDWDGLAPEWGPGGADGRSDGLAAIEAPMVQVQSSEAGHEHGYWLLDEFLTDINILERLNKTVAYASSGDKGCWNANRVLRPPHTINYGVGKNREPLPVEVIVSGSEQVTIKSFDKLPEPRSIVQEELSNLGEYPSLEVVMAKYDWTDEHFKLFKSDSHNTGDRSKALVRLAMFGAEAGFSEEAIMTTLLDADDRWGKYIGRPDREKHLIKIVIRAKAKHPQALSEEVWTEEVSVDAKIIYGYADLLHADIQIEWQIERLLPKQGLGILAAASGVGKTLMTLDMATHMALGQTYLDYEINTPQRVLYLSLEMAAAPLKVFLESQARSLSEEDLASLNKNFFFVPTGNPMNLSSQGQLFLDHLLETTQPDIVFVDSLGHMVEDSQAQTEAMRIDAILKKFRQKFETSFLFIHHNKKPSDKKDVTPAQSNVFGSGYFVNNADLVMTLWKDGDQLKLGELKNRFSGDNAGRLIRRDENLRYHLIEENETWEDDVRPENTEGDLLGG